MNISLVVKSFRLEFSVAKVHFKLLILKDADRDVSGHDQVNFSGVTAGHCLKIKMDGQ